MAETQTSYAKSAFTDPLNIINFIAVALVLPEIRDLVPQEYVRLVAGLTALLNLFVRTFQTTHPVAFIAPMQVVPVEVKKLEATKPGTEDPAKLPPAIAQQPPTVVQPPPLPVVPEPPKPEEKP